ncbi:uncharacterized protein arhgap33 [Garra rufa]|uniref:uncharacterized protein arhgap33 n=1 Tax=Garra rufa TaxID=137080 RepID=UPI003CCE85C6
MHRRATLSGPQWVRKCAMFVRTMSLADMSGFLPRGEQLAIKARSTDNLDSSGEPGTRSVGTTANLKGKMSKRLSVVKGHFPKLVDCAHFHYENVDFGSIELQFANEQSDASWTTGSAKDLVFLVQVSCQGKTWMVRRSYEEFRTLDAHLHQCIYDRRYSQLLALPALCEIGDRVEIFTPLLSEYLNRLSMIVDNKLNCGPVLSWMEIDNHGNRFLLKEEASLNVPAIAAAHVIKRYTAQASDEISIEVGDILSVIDMPPKEDTTWWRGKHGFQVGFFPSECVELINEKLPQSVSAPVNKQEVDASGSKPGVTNTTGPSSPTSVYMLPDFSQEPSASWMAEDVIDFSPTFLEDGPIGLGRTAVDPSGRESPPAAAPPPYRCLSHQAHTRSGSQRSITEDPDSVLNQSEAAARRSLILAAAAPPQQVFCQHRPSAVTNAPASTAQQGESNLSPSHSQMPAPVTAAPPSQPPQERRSFTRKVVHALSPKAPKSPPLDISDPIAISVPAKVLEMIGGRAGELQPGHPSGGPPQPPQMISMLLRSCDFQLTESCQQELSSKLGPIAKIKGPSIMGPTGVPLPSQQPPPPPPKNPARLMALALAESANKALRQGASPPYRPRQSGTPPEIDVRFQRSLSADAGALLSSDPNQIYSTVRPLSVWKTEGDDNNDGDDEDDGGTAAEKPADKSHGTEPRSPHGQDTGTLSSDSSVSDSRTSNSELSAASSSEDNERTPSPIYKNEEPSSPPQPLKSSPPSSSEAVSSQRKPPAYGRQFSAPQLQQDKSSGQSKPAAQPHSQLLHSKSESSPLAQVRAFQPTRPKVPPKPPDLAPLRAPLSQTDRHDYMRRSLDASRIRRLAGQPQGNTPLSRAFSERISSTSDMLSRYHAARMASQVAQVAHLPQQQQQAQSTPIRPVVSSSEDPSKMENFYYEIGAPDHPQVPPSYARHSYQNMKLDLEGNLRLTDPANQRPTSRGYPPPYNPQGPGGGRAPQLWSSEATRAWAAAHSHSHSFSFSHSHHRSQDGSSGHPPHTRPQRQTSSSVRLSRSEVHPLPASVGVGLVPLSVHQRSIHHPQRSPSADHTASQLHPYFENGKVCYRYFEASRPEDLPLNQHQHAVSKPSQASPLQGIAKDQPEHIYVNYPFLTPPGSGVNSKGWATTDLDENDHQASEMLEPPSKSPPDDKQKHSEQESPTANFDSPTQNDVSPDSKVINTAASASNPMHFRSRSDPQSTSSEPAHFLTGKEIASLLIEKLAEDEREGPSVPSSSSSSPHFEHPPNPYPSQQQQQPPPAYNIYTPGPSRGRIEGQMPPREGSGPFQRQDPLRRSSGGQYRQAFDVMPSGDQVLKFYRSQDFIPGAQGESTTPNPYPPRPYYQDPSYPNWGPQGLPDSSHTCTPPTVAFSNLALGSTRGYAPQNVTNQYNQYPYQTGPVLPQYPNTPRRDVVLDPSLRPPGLRNQRGLNRQGSLPGPNWTIRTEGQTRSYC